HVAHRARLGAAGDGRDLDVRMLEQQAQQLHAAVGPAAEDGGAHGARPAAGRALGRRLGARAVEPALAHASTPSKAAFSTMSARASGSVRALAAGRPRVSRT